jgi:hypothetical protein
MTRKTCSIALISALAAALLIVGCSQVLGFKDPTLEDPAHPQDAANDGPTRDGPIIDGPIIDGAIVDGPTIDGPPIDAAIDAPSGPSCVPANCPFGCDTTRDACRPGKLSVFLTNGAFLGDGFGGDPTNPPAARAGADARCLQTYNVTFPTLQCNPARMHAVLSANNSDDSIPLMASRYSIPTTVEVHRASDDVLVFNNWNDLTDNTKSPRAPVDAAPAPDDVVWSGFGGGSSCNSWTSRAPAPTAAGVIGRTSLTVASWLARSSQGCDQFARLLCVCWTGGPGGP